MDVPRSFDQVWRATDPGFRVALEGAWQSLLGRGLPVGAAIATSVGDIIATGRNRVYDGPGGAERLQRTPIAHAEMNALAAVDVDVDLGTCTVFSTHEPCSMCRAAIEFLSVADVRFLVTDPSGIDPGATYSLTADVDPRIALAANVMFLHNVAAVAGTDSEILARNRIGEPAMVDFAIALLDRGTWRDRSETSVEGSVASIWADLSVLADR